LIFIDLQDVGVISAAPCSCSECYVAHSAQLLQFPVWFLGMYSVPVKDGQIIPLCDTQH